MTVRIQPYDVRRAPSGRVFVVEGDAGDGSSDHDMYRYREPHVTLIEVGGRWSGTKFNVPNSKVEIWEIVPRAERMLTHEG